MYEKLSRKLQERAICLKKRCPNPGFFFVDFKNIIASMYVFFEYIALHENPFKKNSTHFMWVKRENTTCFIFPMDADLWVSRGVAEPKLLPGGFGSHHVGQPWLRWSEFH